MRGLSSRFMLFITCVLGVLLALMLWWSYNASVNRVHDQVQRQTALALEFDLAIRGYVGDTVRPILAEKLGSDTFIPECMSTSYVARNVFERVQETHPDYILKFSSINPRNPRNLAGEDERRIIEYFEQHPDKKLWTGVIDIDDRPHIAHFSARWFNESCMRCHSEAELAPPVLLDRYGDRGFGHEPGELAGLDTIAIPVEALDSTIAAEARRQGLLTAIAAVVMLLVTYIAFRMMIGRRLSAMAEHFKNAARTRDTVRLEDLPCSGDDEISVVAKAYNILARRIRSLYDDMDARVQQRTAELGIANERLEEEVRERRQAEQALREREQELRTVTDNMPAWIAYIDADLIYRYANQPYDRALALEGETVVDRPTSDFFDPQDQKRMYDHAYRALAGESVEYECPRYIGGQTVWTVARYVPDVGDDGTVRGFYAMVTDITARREIEQALKQSQFMLELVLNTIPVGVYWKNQNGCYLGCNRHFAEEADLNNPAEIVGMTDHDLFWSNRADEFEREDQQVMLSRRPIINHEEMWTGADGQPGWISMSRIPLTDHEGKLMGVLGISADITEQRRKENALRHATERTSKALDNEKRISMQLEAALSQLETANDEAQAANRTKSEFLANMSHELRTPMTAILGYTELITDAPADVGAVAEHVETIRRNGDHLLRLINDILDLSKIEAGKLALSVQPCDPASIASEVMSLMRPRAAHKNLTLDLEYAGPIPCSIHSDPHRLRQILINLVSNAIKFTDDGGVRIIVRYDGGMLAQQKLIFEVIDTGCGLNPSQIARLFKPFVQVDASSTRRFGGTGLGLVISRRLAHALGGDIRIVSTPEQGSSFIVTATVEVDQNATMCRNPHEAAIDRPSPDASPTRLSQTGRILLAEDGPDNRRLITAILTRAGASVDIAENGKEAYDMALAAAAAGAPHDIIIMDMQMPVMDGYEATQRLRAQGYGGVIIALTAHAMVQDREACLQTGCDDYASKPIARGALIDLVEEHLTRIRARAAGNAETSPCEEQG